MRELLETLDAWRADGVEPGRRTGHRRAHLRVARRGPEGAVLLSRDDGRIAGSVSGGCVEGAAAEEIERARSHRARPGHPLRHQRRAGMGRRPRLRRHDRRARRAGRARSGIDAARASLGAGGRGAAVVTRLPADSPPAGFGPHEPGSGAPPEPELIVHEDGRLEGSLGRPDLDAALVEGALEALKRGTSRTLDLGDALVLRRGVPGPAAARRRRRGGGRALAGPAGRGAWLRNGRRRRPGVVRDRGAVPATSIGWSSAGPTRSPRRSASARTTRSRS